MDNIIFYKLKKYNDHWIVVFNSSRDNNYTIIKDDITKLKEYIDQNKEAILIGANNSLADDKILTSLLKYNNLYEEVSDDDIEECLPITLDITQGIVRNQLIEFNNMICSIWDDNRNILPYKYALYEEEITKQLIADIEIMKKFYEMEERQSFLKWKIDVINNYNLPKKAYQYSYGNIMKEILGIKIEEDNNKKQQRRIIILDEKLQKALKIKNDPFLNSLLKELTNYYSYSNEFKLKKDIDNCMVTFTRQGINGTIEHDIIDTNTKDDNVYLYIDFNSFGPNILINNNWLDQVAKHPEMYKEVKDKRIALKKDKHVEQLYYKYILNSGLDYLDKVTTKNGENVGFSITLTGIMTMMLLYQNIKPNILSLIECNTDGFIVKCKKNKVSIIKEEVKKIEKELSLSCDVDLVKKIAHFNTMNYVMEFEDGSQKHLGVFGLFQSHPLYCSGVKAVEEALREYYLNNIPVIETLLKIRNINDLEAFQIVKRQKRNEKTKYIKVSQDPSFVEESYMPYDRITIRLFAIRKEGIKNPLYQKDRKGYFKEYTVKRGRSVKDGFYYFELGDQELPNIYDIDLTYYLDQCYKIINKHPKIDMIQIMKQSPKRNCFLDTDGTLILDKTEQQRYLTFYNATKDFLSEEEIKIAYNLFSEKKGNYLIRFLGLCKKNKAYGKPENFANLLKSLELFPGQDSKIYRDFVYKYLYFDKQCAKELKPFAGTKKLLEFLVENEFTLYNPTNWFKDIQIEKLAVNDLIQFFPEDKICAIDDYYAKSSVKGWTDLLNTQKVNLDDFNIMIGNGSSDLVPKQFNIQSIILNQTGKKNSTDTMKRGYIVNSVDEVIDPNFMREMEEVKKLKKIK